MIGGLYVVGITETVSVEPDLYVEVAGILDLSLNRIRLTKDEIFMVP